MKPFNYFQPTEIVFGSGRVKETGAVSARFGKKCLLVTVAEFPAMAPLFAEVKELLRKAGSVVTHFNGVIPNPTTDVVSAGARMAREAGADVVIGLGGGSSMDTAKAIAVEATHDGTCWDYLFYKKAPTEKTLPIIAIPTTSGTGSQTTPCAVITKTDEHDKSALWHPALFPRVALVDPLLMLTLPKPITAMTGFDAFTHAFEAFISTATNPLVEALALSAIRLIVKHLPAVVADGSDTEGRQAMAWADTLGGLAIASGGVTLPHGLGMQIGGHCPHVAHGQALAALYPAFTRFTFACAVEKFAAVARIFNPKLARQTDQKAAEACCAEVDAFLRRIGMWVSLKSLGVPKEEVARIAADGQVLSDYKNNPRVATLEEMHEILVASYERRD
ncbi:MAG: iron-containing alcohol dehydrogenase [Spirochaetes bacterium]|nr:iron-containing alcohol dehydrogenase [Spirochaetota bacterium]